MLKNEGNLTGTVKGQGVTLHFFWLLSLNIRWV